MTRFRAALLVTAIIAAFVGFGATRTSPLITFTLGSTAITLGTTTTTVAGLTLTTPTIGVATATSVNKVAITAPATSATLTITDGKTLSYDDGTWTPTLVGSATPGTGQTYSTQVGSYEKIGRQVTVRFYITATSLGTAAGNIQIGGLPFTANATTNDNGACVMSYIVTGLAALNYGVLGYIDASTTVAKLVQNGSTTVSFITVTQAGTGPTFFGMCNYHT